MTYGQCIIHDFNGNIIARSKNLRGVTDRARKLQHLGPTKLTPKRLHGINGTEGTLIVNFPDESWCVVQFVSFAVLALWVKQRVHFGTRKFISDT